jgi:hypothetical protein
MLILQIALGIALGIVLGYVLIVHLDRALYAVVWVIALILLLGTSGLLLWGIITVAVERPPELVWFSWFVMYALGAGGLGIYLSNNTRLTTEETTGIIVVTTVMGFALLSMWGKYQKVGEVSEEALRIAPFLVLLLVLAGVLVKRVRSRSKTPWDETDDDH